MPSTSQRKKQYRTAVARRRANPLYLEVDEHEPVRTVDNMDLGALAGLLADVQNPLPDDLSQVAGVQVRLTQLRNLIAEFIHPGDKVRWAQDVAPDLAEVAVLSAMMNDLVEEYTGVDPTKQASSSDGSPPTGPASTDGAPPAALMPLLSPPIAP